MLELQANRAVDTEPQSPGPGLRGERLSEASVEEDGKWPLRRRFLTVLGLGALAWLVVLVLPGLLNDFVGLLLGLLFRVMT